MENMNNPYSNNTKAAWYIIIFMVSALILMSLLTGCVGTYYVVDPIYEDHPHTTEIYYNGVDIYFGYHSGFYYYYGKPHFYPWWYYYQFIPPYYYHTHTHIYIQCEPGNYVYGHRGPLFHNVGPDCPNNQGRFIPTIKSKNNKDKSFVFSRDWKSSNSTRINKQTNINYNTNKIKHNNSFNINRSKNNTTKSNRPNRSTKPNKKRP